KPLTRVVLRLEAHVVKGYGSAGKYRAAVRALRRARTSGLPTASLECAFDDLRATVQTALPGTVALDDARLAPVAGALLRELHAAPAAGLPPSPPSRHVEAATEAA